MLEIANEPTLLDRMGITMAEVEESIQREKTKQNSNPGICICGHNARSHQSQRALEDGDEFSGSEFCNPARQACQCSQYRQVVRSNNVRLFIYKTTGPYSDHALSKGIKAALVKNYEADPAVEWKCDSCESADRVGPVPVNTHGRLAFESSPANFLLCAACFQRLKEGTLFVKPGASAE